MNTLQKALQGSEPVLTAELSLRHGTASDEVLRQARLLSGAVDSIQVAENPNAWVQMSPLGVAELLLREGLDPTVRLHCRDRNRIALKSDLLGLKALGVRSLVLNRGNKIPDGHDLHARAVFDVSCREFITMADEMNQAEGSLPGNEIILGTGVRVFSPPPDWDAELLLTRTAESARFLQSQLCLDVDLLRRYMSRLVEKKITWKFAVMVTLAPLPSAETAHWLLENSPGAVIPESVIERLESAGDAETEGIKLCAEQMQAMTRIPGVSGFNLLTLGHPEAVVAAIKASGLRTSENDTGS